MSKIIFGSIQPNPKEAKVWLHPHDGLKTYNQKKQEWTGSGSSNDAPTDEPESLYEFVDLGLPSGLLWAAWNVGATKPEEFGLYFAWGETEGYTGVTDSKKFGWSDYKWCNGSSTTLTKYNNDSSYGTVDTLTTLEQDDDVAYVSDNSCRMPTYDECQELISNTTSAWTSINGVNGIQFTSTKEGYTDKSIFIPAAGRGNSGSLDNVGLYGYIWSSSLHLDNSRYAHYLRFNSGSVYMLCFCVHK